MKAAFIGLGLFIVINFAAWAEHVITCIRHQEWILLIFGIIVPPIGFLHGWALWFGILTQ